MPTRTYLDHAASSPTLPEVVEAMAPWWGRPGNPSSLHASGRAARAALEEARESLAADLGCRPGEVVLTSGGSEANTLALLGSRTPERAGLAISAVEHPSVAAVRDRPGPVAVLPVRPSGHLEPADAAGRLDQATALVSVMWVNNETGAVQPVAAVAGLAHEAGALAHSDAVQAFGHLPVDFAGSGLDLLTVSAHKLGGPVGVGALVVRRGVRLTPVGFGGGQEARLRSGTVPVALAVGFAAASRVAAVRREAEHARLAGLRDRLLAGVRATVPGAGVNTFAPCAPTIANVTFPGSRADDLLLLLDLAGFDASTGSACTAGVHQPSEVLLAMGRNLAEAAASVRFSLGPDTTTGQVEALLDVLPALVARARGAA